VPPPRDPTRRNRTIGQPGHGSSTAVPFDIPEPGRDWNLVVARLDPVTAETFEVHGAELTVLTQEPTAPWIHTCTAEDVAGVLRRLPAADVAGIGLVVLRQPTRKQLLFSDAWGRIVYDLHWRAYRGPVIMLEALVPDTWLRWNRSIGPDAQRELARLEADGLQMRPTRRGPELLMTAENARRTQLYRTLPHEVGHWVDYRDGLLDRRRPRREREDFAHRYAERAKPLLLDAAP
jgi:hypothetical protein